MSEPAQMSFDEVHACPICLGKGWNPGNTSGQEGNVTVVGIGPVLCRVCRGTGSVNYDPEDKTIPY